MSTSPAKVSLHVYGRTYCLNRKYLVARSGKLATLLKDNKNEYTFDDIPGDIATFTQAMRFCYGYEVKLTAVNIVPLVCLAYYLEMTENHSPGNLLNKSRNFFQMKVLPVWNESIKALRTAEQVFQQAAPLGLGDACLESLLGKAKITPGLLGEPFQKPRHNQDSYNDDDDQYDDYRPNARKRLFLASDSCESTEGLTALPLRLYQLLMSKMIQCGIPSEYVAGSLFRYARKQANVGIGDDDVIESTNSCGMRDVIETIEKLLPDETGLLPCKLLFQMLQSAVKLQASSNCRYGFETRIGKQLNKAKVEDLLLPSSQCYGIEVEYDIECVKRILKNFYSNYTSSDPSGLIAVAELIEEFLAKVASDEHLTKDEFISLAAISIATSVETKRFLDGIYRAIDVYLQKRMDLTESEREEVCDVLDCYKMSPEACTHAAQNERLPLRMVVQALFVGQLQLRDAITSKTEESHNRSQMADVLVSPDDGEEVQIEMEKMDSRMVELENEYCKMRKEIEKGGVKEKGKSKWKALKRKFGCMSNIHDYNCHVKKVHPRNGMRVLCDFKSLVDDNVMYQSRSLHYNKPRPAG